MKLDPDCARARETMAAGERPAELRRHLAGCAACRVEAGRFGAVLEWLRRGAELEVPPALDAAVRALLSQPARSLRPFARPAMAAGLAVAACLALGSTLAIGVAEAGAGDLAPLLGAGLLLAYLAASSAALLPLLLVARRSARGVAR